MLQQIRASFVLELVGHKEPSVVDWLIGLIELIIHFPINLLEFRLFFTLKTKYG
jgi:hypothetical protein